MVKEVGVALGVIKAVGMALGMDIGVIKGRVWFVGKGMALGVLRDGCGPRVGVVLSVVKAIV